MDRDRLAKELLTTFFIEFLELFFTELLQYLDRDSIEFLDKEVLTDVTEGECRKLDLLVKARFQGQSLFFLIHVENQAQPQAEFARRMFTYFARLHDKVGAAYLSDCVVLVQRAAAGRAGPVPG